MLICATGLHALSLQTTLSREVIATSAMSSGLWQDVVEALGGSITQAPSGQVVAQVDLMPIMAIEFAVALVAAVSGAWWIARRSGTSYLGALTRWMLYGWMWWLAAGAWEVAQWFSPESVVRFLAATPQIWQALALAGWLATFFALSSRRSTEDAGAVRDSYRVPPAVWVAFGVYVVTFVVLNCQLYNGLWTPHGDSAMYEEHLWNVLHGKGFRSYLDQGLFLGEHIQLVHLLLIPLGYFAWPDHRLLEFWESFALASAALPVFWIAQRHTGSARAAIALACAYLLYVPMHFLDIAIDLKSFRPTSFGVPLFLFAIDQWERGRLWSTLALLVVTLSAKEEYAIVIACFGLWIALGGKSPSEQLTLSAAKQRTFGAVLVGFCIVYLLLAVLVIIPWFRSGAQVHYSRYFPELGSTPGEIVVNAIKRPGLVLSILFSGRSLYYALALLLPLGFLPLRSPGRLAVAAPLFGMLCLLQFDGPVVPLHHFHAPIVPILAWSAAAGLGCVYAAARKRASETKSASADNSASPRFPIWATHFAWTAALSTVLFYSLTPLGIPFWDSGSRYYWRNLYVPGQRAEFFPRVYALIPKGSRVASTDFVHPRFTHHERSYDYSNYRRKVSNYELRVPDDTDYIVIDTRHPYSEVHSPAGVRELKQNPDDWELLPDETEGYFIVLKRRRG